MEAYIVHIFDIIIYFSSITTSYCLQVNCGSSSTSITASWQLPPVFGRHRDITGFKLFYKKKGCGGSATTLTISSGSILSRNVTGLDKFTEYEFQVLAFTSDGDGPKSPVVVKRTKGNGM